MIILKNGDLVQYDDPHYGKGKGVICGYRMIGEKNYYAVQPKVIITKDGYTIYIIPGKNLMEIPF